MDEDLYEEAGMGNAVGFGERPAVVVVDVQRAFTDPASPLGMDVDDEVAAIASLLDDAAAAAVPIVTVRTEYTEGLEEAAYFAHKIESNDRLLSGSPGVELDERIARADAKVVVKQQPSAFFGTELDTVLTYERVDTVVVTGLTTSGCIRATVVDACSHGYRVVVPEECVGDRLAEPHEANLFDMRSKYADVLPVAEVREAIAGDRSPLEAEPGDAR